MRGVPDELLLPTFSARRLGRVIVFVCRSGHDIGDQDWAEYVGWLKALQSNELELKILTAAGGRAPSAAQRSLISRELNTDAMRVAVLLSDAKLLAIVRVTSWFMKGTKAFGAHEIEKALTFLGETDAAGVRAVIRDLGGVVYTAAV